MLAEMLHISLQTVKFYESRTRKASASVLDLLSYKIADLLNEQKKAKLRWYIYNRMQLMSRIQIDKKMITNKNYLKSYLLKVSLLIDDLKRKLNAKIKGL